MADGCAVCDRDSAFGDDEPRCTRPKSMFPVAGSKREAALLGDDAQSQAPVLAGSELGQHGAVDPRVLKTDCCAHCPDACSERSATRPIKRRASPQRVADYHNLAAATSSEVDCQFPDDCFEQFCQECNLDPICPPDCAVSCPSPQCADVDACFDPHCAQKDPACTDGCADPACTKTTCPDKPCFCQKCDAQPCPLGDPDNECHLAHSAPTPVGTIYCYDNAPCHFQDGHHAHNHGLTAFETYPCFSHNHGYSNNPSSAPTPTLSHSNFTSLESAFTSEASPVPGHTSFANCLLNISGDHCHIDNSCCHGPRRACGDCPSASPNQLDFWSSSIAQGNGLANNFLNFNFQSQPTSPISAGPSSMNSANPFSLDNHMLALNNQSWMLPDSAFSNAFQPATFTAANKLDFLASAVQQDILRPSAIASGSIVGTDFDSSPCLCKWQHAPGVLCLAMFESAEALHKHVKTSHVDNCTHCFCQWENCEASSKDFKQRSKLSRHLLGHAGHRPYACSYAGCDKTFATNQAKDNHERTHTGERPYVCDRCGYTTTTHTQLQTHISALHEGKKPHKCRFCEFTCADSSNLSKHERTHQTLRPYRCPHANCTFKPDCRWENLKRHLRRSGHCPQLLFESSDEYKTYRESVRHEIEDWHKRNQDGGLGKAGRRKGRG
ncbi:zinc-finger protein [Coniothyrium glycines]